MAVRPDTLHYRHSYSLLLQSAVVSDRHIDHLVTMALKRRKITVLQVLLLPDHLSLSESHSLCPEVMVEGHSLAHYLMMVCLSVCQLHLRQRLETPNDGSFPLSQILCHRSSWSLSGNKGVSSFSSSPSLGRAVNVCHFISCFTSFSALLPSWPPPPSPSMPLKWPINLTNCS